MTDTKAFDDHDVLIDLGAVSEETKGPGGDEFEQDEPLFRE